MITSRAKNKEEEEEVDKNAWMVTFSDLLTLMLTFFVLLLTMSSMDTAEIGEVFGLFTSILPKTGQGPLGTFESESIGLYGGAGRDAISGAPEGMFGLPLKSVPRRVMRVEAEGLEHLLIKFADDAETKFTDFSEEETNELKNIKVHFMAKGITVYLPNELFFKPGKADITPVSKAVLNLLGEWVKARPYNMKIEGHTDNAQVKSIEFSSKWELSVTRAVNMMRYFIENKTIAAEKISAFGYSEFQPLLPNDSEKNMKNNRRMEIVFNNPKSLIDK